MVTIANERTPTPSVECYSSQMLANANNRWSAPAEATVQKSNRYGGTDYCGGDQGGVPGTAREVISWDF
jgi:hypothetical protein